MKALLEQIDVLIEDSYGVSDIPSNFYLVFNFDADRNPDRLKQLAKGKIEGVKGISGSNQIVLEFVPVGRNAVLKMDGKRVIRDNNLSRVMYDNPHYLMSKDMNALKRLLNKDLSHDDQSVRKSTISSILDPILRAYSRDYHSPEGKIAMFIKSYDFEILKETPDRAINSIKDLARHLKRVTDKIASDKKRELPFSLSDWERELTKAVQQIADTYKKEAEWLVKDDVFDVPAGSTLMIGVRDFDEETEELYREWKRRKESGEGPEGLSSDFIRELGRHKYWFEKQYEREKAVEDYNLEDRYRIRFIDQNKIKNAAVDLRFG